MTRRHFLTGLGAAAATAFWRRDCYAVSNTAAEIVTQSSAAGDCGPCALSNALLNGNTAGRTAYRQLAGTSARTRADTLIRQYGAKPSETYGPRRGRFLNAAGLPCGDMPFLANDFLTDAKLPKVTGGWLDRQADETQPAQLSRLHGLFKNSLANGFPPVVEVRAFAADTGSSKSSWVNLYAHWLTVLGVDPVNLPAGASGFLCEFADSFTGKVITGFAHVELNRPFMATRGFTLKKDGSQDWQWLTGEPYILIEVPDIPLLLQTRPWQNRTLVALDYIVYRPTAA